MMDQKGKKLGVQLRNCFSRDIYIAFPLKEAKLNYYPFFFFADERWSAPSGPLEIV